MSDIQTRTLWDLAAAKTKGISLQLPHGEAVSLRQRLYTTRSKESKKNALLFPEEKGATRWDELVVQLIKGDPLSTIAIVPALSMLNNVKVTDIASGAVITQADFQPVEE